MSDIVISGYYGLGNSGDEALLKCIVDDLRKKAPDITVTALSGNAELTHRQYNVKTVNRFNLFSVVREIACSKLLISGGGTLIQDATSTKSLIYYLAIISIAKLFRKKVMLYANGMGPIKDKNIGKVKRVLNKVDLITLRENVSLNEIKRCGITVPKVIVTADPAFNLVPANEKCTEDLMREFCIPADKNLLAVSVRDCKYLKSDFADKMAYAVDSLCEKGYFPLFMPMQMSCDLEITEEVTKKMKHKSIIIDRELQIAQLLALIGKCRLACGMRLHMLIFASVVNVPMAGIVYDPKIKGFMDFMKQTSYVELGGFDSDEFVNMVVRCGENCTELKEKLGEASKIFREKASENATLAIELVRKK